MPTIMPVAATAQIVAAVDIPRMIPAPCKIAPAPRNPMPVTTCAATRPESPVVVTNAKEAIVKLADPRQTRTSVRKPAGFSLFSRSVPTIAPQPTETSVSTICSQGTGSQPRKSPVSKCQSIIPFRTATSLRQGESSRRPRHFAILLRFLHQSGLHAPDTLTVVADGTVRTELAHARHVQNALAGPRVRIAPKRIDLRVTIDVGLKIREQQKRIVIQQ